MIIYPDGSTLYWLEGYPNDLNMPKDNKKVITGQKSMNEVYKQYVKEDFFVEEDSMAAMQVMASGQEKIW